jgi:hypothetical protein
MGRGDDSPLVRRKRRQRKHKKREARRKQGYVRPKKIIPSAKRAQAQVKVEFLPLDQVKKLTAAARIYLREHGITEAYYDAQRGDFVARRGDFVIRGGKISPYDWERC